MPSTLSSLFQTDRKKKTSLDVWNVCLDEIEMEEISPLASWELKPL
jgi:hypothetical protein